MSSARNPVDRQKDLSFKPLSSPPDERETRLGWQRSLCPAFPFRNRPWIARLIQLCKDLLGEPSNTNLPDLHQENP